MSNNYDANERNSAMSRAALLIADMTLDGATQEELERVILYSADIIRSNKEDVDWKQSYEDYVIEELEDKYLDPFDMSEVKDYVVIDENYVSGDGSTGRGVLLGDFDTYEEAEAFVKKKETPRTNLKIFGPAQK